MDQEATKGVIRAILDGIKRESFVEGYGATDAEAMGLLVSRFFEWGGIEIMRSAEYALEDANFHAACASRGRIRAAEEDSVRSAERIFRAPSQSERGKSYRVILRGDGSSACTCPAFTYRSGSGACKHIRSAALGAYSQVH